MINIDALEKATRETETLLKAHVKQYARKDGTIVKEHDDSRQAHAASSAANDHHSRMKFDDPKDMAQNAKLHHDAAMKHLAAYQKGRAEGDEGAKDSYYRASHHLASAHSSRSFIKGNEEKAAQEASKTADQVSKMAHKHQVEHTAESLDVGAGMHLLAQEAHHRAAQAHERAYSRKFDDTAGRAEHEKAMAKHKEAAAEHGKKVQEITGVTIKASDKARTLGEHAKTPEDHIAASRAHSEAAKLNYDSEGRAENEKAAKWHAEQAKKGAADDYKRPDHVKNKEDEYDHLSRIPANKRTAGEKARLKKIVSQAGLGKQSAEYKKFTAEKEKK